MIVHSPLQWGLCTHLFELCRSRSSTIHDYFDTQSVFIHIPVSYTHLDVYKRQTYMCVCAMPCFFSSSAIGKLWIIVIPWCLWYTMIHYLNNCNGTGHRRHAQCWLLLWWQISWSHSQLYYSFICAAINSLYVLAVKTPIILTTLATNSLHKWDFCYYS